MLKQRRKQGQLVVKKEGPVEIGVPITVRSLSEAIGMKAGELILRLKKETNALYTINSIVEFDVAELIAVDKGIQLVIKKQADTPEFNIVFTLRIFLLERKQHGASINAGLIVN